MNFYDFNVKNNKGEQVSLSNYKGKALLVVNTATKCGLTPQYDALEALYKKYSGKGLEILDFPCNQFLEQAPGSDEEINSFCTLNYGTTFPRFEKVEVNGENTHALFAWLKDQVTEGDDAAAAEFREKVKTLSPWTGEKDLKWNFTKFLVDKNGAVVGRYSPDKTPEQIEKDILALLEV